MEKVLLLLIRSLRKLPHYHQVPLMVVNGDDDDDQLLLAEKLSKGEDIKIPLKRHVRVSVLLHDMLL